MDFLEAAGMSTGEFYNAPETAIGIAKEFGIKKMEFLVDTDPKNDIAAFEKLLPEMAENGISVSCINTWVLLMLPKDRDERKALLCDIIECAGANKVPVVNTYFGKDETLSFDEQFSAYKDIVSPVLDVCEKNGVTLTLENEFDPEGQGRELTGSAERMLKLMEMVGHDRFGVTFDPCNFLIAGEEPYPHAYELLRPFIKHIHLKAATKKHPLRQKEDIKFDHHSGDYFYLEDIGECPINYTAFLRRVAADGYDGALVLEPHMGSYEPIKRAVVNTLDFLRNL